MVAHRILVHIIHSLLELKKEPKNHTFLQENFEDLLQYSHLTKQTKTKTVNTVHQKSSAKSFQTPTPKLAVFATHSSIRPGLQSCLDCLLGIWKVVIQNSQDNVIK